MAVDLVWTSRLRREYKKSALEFLIHPLAPAGRYEATPAVGAAAVQVIHAEEPTGRYEATPVVGAPAVQEIHDEEPTGRYVATPATVAVKEETRGLNGSLAVPRLR